MSGPRWMYGDDDEGRRMAQVWAEADDRLWHQPQRHMPHVDLEDGPAIISDGGYQKRRTIWSMILRALFGI